MAAGFWLSRIALYRAATGPLVRRLHSGRAGSPVAPPACPFVGGAAGVRAGSEGGGRDSLGSADEGLALPGAAWPCSADGKAACAAIGSTTMLVCTCARPAAY